MIQLHLSKKAELSAIDRIVLAVSVVYPLSGVPQIVKIFTSHSAEGVSLMSWLLFTIFAAIFLVYGIAHRLKPVIITNALWLMIDILVVVGIVMYS